MPRDSVCGGENTGMKHQGVQVSAVWRAEARLSPLQDGLQVQMLSFTELRPS